MNIRIPSAFDTAGVKPVAGEIRRGARMHLVWIALGVAVAALVGWYVYKVLFAVPEKKPPPPVKVAAAWTADITVAERTIGTVLANSTVQVTSRVEGQLDSAAFKEGDIVHAGDLLFRLDPKPFQAALLQAQAQLAKDQAQLMSAQNDRKRYTTLFAQGAASSQQRDQSDASAKSLAASVASDRAAVQMAQLNLGYTQIRSPIDGKTGPILIQPGNLVPASGTSPLVVVTQIQPVKVSFSLPQADLPRIQARQRKGGLTASIDLHDERAAPLTAPVDFLSNAVSGTTGTIELRANYANADLRLVPGQLVDVSVALNSLPGAVVVPREAVNIGPDNRYVFVVAHGKADMRVVSVLYDAGSTMAIKGDVKAGDKVITDGQIRVMPGKKVEIVGKEQGAAKEKSKHKR